MKITQSLVNSQNKLGEGPLWHAEEQALYWVDIHQNLVERFHPASKVRKTWRFSQPVTSLGINAAGGFVVTTSKCFGFWDGHSSRIEEITNPEPDLPDNRFNDGAVGPSGGYWAGTMREQVDLKSPPPGSFYHWNNRIATLLESNLYISNGLGWSPDQNFFYLTDSPLHTIYRYTYDHTEGEFGERQIWVHTPDEPGVPDGLSVDADGCVWSARWGGWKVIRYDPDGVKMQEILLPVAHPTSCAFGGAALNELFITSAWTPLSPEQRAEQPLAGDIFHLPLDVKGQPVYQASL